jgi:rhodanese-related sulfurtransferase
MRRLHTAALVVLTLLLAACSAAPSAPVVQVISDVKTVPLEIDVAAARSLHSNPEVFFLDVREPSEYDAGHIPGVTLIPVSQVAGRLSEIPKDKQVVVTCRSGNRSGQVAQQLRQLGYTNITNMQGGLNAWQNAGYPVER